LSEKLPSRARPNCAEVDNQQQQSLEALQPHGDSLDVMIVPLAANMPPTPWQT
jgi:hypothetical protein